MIGTADAGAQFATYDATVQVGQAEVEQHEISRRSRERRRTRRRMVDGESFPLQSGTQGFRDRGVVLDHQQMHGAQVRMRTGQDTVMKSIFAIC